jgi:hypothetical protein
LRLHTHTHQIFTKFLPKINLTKNSAWAGDKDDRDFSCDDSAVKIVKGELVTGEEEGPLGVGCWGWGGGGGAQW